MSTDVYGHGTAPHGELFDLPAAHRAGEHGQELAATSDRAWGWAARAHDALEHLARTGRTFTADDLYAAVGLPDAGPNRNNAVGAVFAAARKRGVIVKTGHYRPSKRVVGHGRIVAVWTGNPDFER